MGPTVIIALITAIAAIVAPVITAIITNKNNLKMKEIETREYRLKNVNLHERDVLEKALSGIGTLMSWKDADGVKEACKNILMAVAYVDEPTGDKLISIVGNVLNTNKKSDDNSQYMYYEISDSIKREIEKRTLV